VKHALKSCGGVVQPSQLVKNLRSFSKQFRVGRQEDAHEFMRYLVEALHKCCLPPGAAKLPPEKQSSFIYRAFAGRLRSQVGLARERLYLSMMPLLVLTLSKTSSGKKGVKQGVRLRSWEINGAFKKGGERLVDGQFKLF
jgi:hypothetical protein